MKKDEEPVVVEQTFDASIESVWNSITDVNEMKQWYFSNIPSFKAEVGFETQFLVKNEGREFPHAWKVTEVIPLNKLVYGWKFDGYEGNSFVVFELAKDDNKTKLTLTCIVTEDFSDDIPEFRRESCIAGWEYFIQQSLKKYLDK